MFPSMNRRSVSLGSGVLISISVVMCMSARLGNSSSVVGAVVSAAQTRDGRDIPRGTLTHHRWTESRIFPGTERDYWVYVPAQYDGARPACVMVFQDGGAESKVPGILDQLIDAQEMPVTIAVLVAPGQVPPPVPDAKPRLNRSVEYDSLGERYARFLLDEILPAVGKEYRLAQDGNSRAIGGFSSGAIAAFTAAWERPDAFSRVFSAIGSYVGFRGGNEYATLIRKTEPKPLRIFLQDGNTDANIFGGDWWMVNQDVLSALKFSGYEVNHQWGTGGHSAKEGLSSMPDALRWLWHDYPAPITAGNGSQQPVLTVLMPGESWQRVALDHPPGGALATNAHGQVFFADAGGKLWVLGNDDTPHLFAAQAHGTTRLAFGPDGRLFASELSARRVVAYEPSGKRHVVANGIAARDLAVTASGRVYASDPTNGRIWLIDANHHARTVYQGLTSPGALHVTPDQSWLYATDSRERLVYSFQVRPDGSLAHGQPFCYLHVPSNELETGATAVTMDTSGRLYVATSLGVQLCDSYGRVEGIIAQPASSIGQLTFGGNTLGQLYAVSRDAMFRRMTKATGALNFQAPAKPLPTGS
jgi:gluconolactonase